MDYERDREAMGGLAKGVRVRLGALRQAGIDERPLDAIDREVADLHRLADRFAEEAMAHRDSVKASAFGLAGRGVVPKRGKPMPFEPPED